MYQNITLVTNLLCKKKMVSAAAATWLPDTKRFFMELSARARQRRNTTATQFDSSDYMTSLPVLRHHFRFLIFYETSFTSHMF